MAPGTLICYHFESVFFRWLEALVALQILVQRGNQRIQTFYLAPLLILAASAEIPTAGIFVIQHLPCLLREDLGAAVSPAGWWWEAAGGVLDLHSIV